MDPIAELRQRAAQARANIGYGPNPAFASYHPDPATAERLRQFMANSPTQMPQAPQPEQPQNAPPLISLDQLSGWAQQAGSQIGQWFNQEFRSPHPPPPSHEEMMANDPGVQLYRYLQNQLQQHGPAINQRLHQFIQSRTGAASR